MILAFHLVVGAYGFWLPNDPRGSGSDHVWSNPLRRFGPATKVKDRRRSRAARAHDHELRLAAKHALKHPPTVFTGIQARAVARGFAQACRESGYVISAAAVLPEHVHLVVGRHPRSIRRIAGHLKARATQRLKAEGFWPDAERHYLREAARPIFEADRHAKKELKKRVRGIRPLERQVESRTDPEATVVRDYSAPCAALSPTTADRRWPRLD